MKQCPTCQSQYTDDTLQFCLQDGSPLRFVAGSPESAAAAFNGEQETIVAGRKSEQINPPPVTSPTGWNPSQYQSNPAVQPPAGKSGATAAVFATAFVMLLLFGFVGIGAWLYFRGVSNDPNKNVLIAKRDETDVQNANKSTVPVKTPSVAATVPPTTAANANTAATAPVDKEQVRRDVSQKVNAWKEATEARDVEAYMSNYAGTVDYYNKKGASLATVRADKQRAFAAFDSMRITLSNLTVTPDAAGETATAVFDKEWVFEGAKYSAGKVQSQLKLKKVNGNWLITGERDLKVYYTE